TARQLNSDWQRGFAIVMALVLIVRGAIVEVRRQRNILLVNRVVQAKAYFLGERKAKPELRTDRARFIVRISGGVVLPGEKIDAPEHAIAEQIGLRIGQVDTFGLFTIRDGNLGVFALSHQVSFADAYRGEKSDGGGITALNGEFAGCVLFDVDVQDHAVGRRAAFVGDLDRLEIAEVLQPPFGAIYQCAIVGVAFADIEFAADHIVPRAIIAVNIDALDIGARAFLNEIRKINRSCLDIAVAARLNRGEGVTALRHFERQIVDGLLHRFGIVDIARASAQHRSQRCRVDVADIRLNVDLADVI